MGESKTSDKINEFMDKLCEYIKINATGDILSGRFITPGIEQIKKQRVVERANRQAKRNANRAAKRAERKAKREVRSARRNKK